jgi:hypothetical protein
MRDFFERLAMARPKWWVPEQYIGPLRALRIPVDRDDIFLLETAQRPHPADHGALQRLEHEARPFGRHPGLLGTEAARASVIRQLSHQLSLSSSQWKLWRGTSAAARATAGAATDATGMIVPVPRS